MLRIAIVAINGRIDWFHASTQRIPVVFMSRINRFQSMRLIPPAFVAASCFT